MAEYFWNSRQPEIDVLHSWSLRLAEQVAPDEIDLAPAMAEAFLKEDQSHDDLFRQVSAAELGGFGAAEVLAIFPWLLKSIKAAAPFLVAILSDAKRDKDLLSITQKALEILEKKDNILVATNSYAPLRRAVAAMTKELEAVPLQQEQRDLIVYRVLCSLLEEPTGACQFVQIVGGIAREYSQAAR